MKPSRMAALSSAIAIALAGLGANAQQTPDQASSTAPGLYVTVNQGEIYIVQGASELDVKVKEAAFVGQDTMQLLDAVPEFLNWPCGGSGGQDLDLVPTYPLASLPPGNQLEEVVRRFFEGPEIPESRPAWLNGESHGSFPTEEIKRFSSKAYWYESGKTTPKLEALRPKILLISLYPATQQVIVDQNHFQELLAHYGSEDIPVTFIFNQETVVPISYFGKDVSVQQVAGAYFEKDITIADTPMWYAGDRHLTASPGELEQVFDIPAIEDIDPDRMAALAADLQTYGFSRKPVNVTLMSQNGSMVIDGVEKIRAAQSIGTESIPIVFFSYHENSHQKRCGLAMPQIAIAGGIGEGGVAAAAADATVTPAESRLAREKLASDN